MSKPIKSTDYHLFRKYLEEHTGIVLGDSKQYLVSSRLSELLEENDLNDLTALIKKIEEDKFLKVKVIDAMTTNETNWFRDVHPFKIFQEKILPEFVKKGIGQKAPLKIWCAASSSGQEPYTIAMAFLEFKQKNPGTFPEGMKLLGTDISAEMIEASKRGTYDRIAMSRGLNEERMKNFFNDLGEGHMEVKKELKDMMNFRTFNLLDNFVLLGRFDIVFCRNVLIYFSKDVKKDIIHKLCGSLNLGGYMYLGASETIDVSHEKFEIIQCNPGIVYQKT